MKSLLVRPSTPPDERCQKLEIDWLHIDKHLEGLGDLVSIGWKITLCMAFVYKEAACDCNGERGEFGLF